MTCVSTLSLLEAYARPAGNLSFLIFCESVDWGASEASSVTFGVFHGSKVRLLDGFIHMTGGLWGNWKARVTWSPTWQIWASCALVAGSQSYLQSIPAGKAKNQFFFFFNGMSLSLSTTLQGRPHSRELLANIAASILRGQAPVCLCLPSSCYQSFVLWRSQRRSRKHWTAGFRR